MIKEKNFSMEHLQEDFQQDILIQLEVRKDGNLILI